MTFKGGLQQMHGSNNGQPFRPDFRVTIANTSADQFNRVFGTVTGSTITSIGFRTTRGVTHNPIGPGPGEPFLVEGLVLGFFGALENGAISGFGVWYMAMGGPNPWPWPVPFPSTFLEMSPAYGNPSNAAMWDDTIPEMGGVHMFLASIGRVSPAISQAGHSLGLPHKHVAVTAFVQRLSKNITS
jgi:hypothetical protein